MSRIEVVMRTNLAQLILLTAALTGGCGASHGPGDDAAVPDGSTDGAFDPRPDGSSDAGGDTGTGPRIDGGASSCDADAVAVTFCLGFDCDEAPRFFWNGDGCFPIECGACAGEGCEGGTFDEAECIDAHASCEASLCGSTGGTWRFWSEECEHWGCGVPMPSSCVVGRAVCDCGAYRSFDSITGCYRDDSCPTAEPTTEEDLCRVSGGNWESICCPTECGDFCAAACAGLACNCGPGKVFEDARGCIEATRCFERRQGQTCDARSRCETGTICCEYCSEPGPPTCEYPLCI